MLKFYQIGDKAGVAMTEQIDEILQFWFGELQQGYPVADRSKLWWQGGPEQDRLIDELFGARVCHALAGGLDHWAENPRGRLALILLLDQFTRSIFRGTAEAFAGDRRALRLCKEGLEKGHDRALEYAERVFFYMPLEHAEDLDAQERSIRQFQRLYNEVPDSRRPEARNNLDYAHQHRDLIVRFGRFPYRNAALGRDSSEEELSYLNQAHNRWGQ